MSIAPAPPISTAPESAPPAPAPPASGQPLDLTAGLTTPRGTDYYLLSELLTDSEREIRDRVRNFVDTQVLPIINNYWERAQFPSNWCRRSPNWLAADPGTLSGTGGWKFNVSELLLS